jgi:hypothetical protein
MKKRSLTLILFLAVLLVISGCNDNNNQKIKDNTYSNLSYSELRELNFDEYYFLCELNNLISDSTGEILSNLSVINPGYNQINDLEFCENNKPNINFSNQKLSNFDFNYVDKKFEYSISLFEELYNYSSDLKTQDCYFDESFYENKFFQDIYNNELMEIISNDFYKLKEEGFSTNEILEIATIFVQRINYGSDSSGFNRYPYETMYETEGNCLDKSIILINILKYLGYETYLIFGDSDDQGHAIVGVTCEEGNFEYNNKKICAIETTALDPIGTEVNMSNIEFKKFSEGNKYSEENYGKEYLDSIKEFLDNLENASNNLDDISLQLEEIDRNLGDLGWQATNLSINQYNALVEEYNNLLPEHSSAITRYYAAYFELDEKLFFNKLSSEVKNLSINEEELIFENCWDWSLYLTPHYLFADKLSDSRIKLVTTFEFGPIKILENSTWRDGSEIKLYGKRTLLRGKTSHNQDINYFYSDDSTFLTHGRKGEENYLKIRDLVLREMEDSNKFEIVSHYVGSCTYRGN